MQSPVRKLIYVGDPMCSWCWGFAPEIESLAKEHTVEIVLGGLRPGPAAQPLEGGMIGFLRTHWVEIAQRTGQPFDTRFLDDNEGWLYDTEPAARAVVTFRRLAESDTLTFFTAIQRAFYADGRDVTDLDVLTELAEPLLHDSDGFANELASERSTQLAWADFTRSRNWGISGFPTLIGELEDDRLALLARGWTKADLIRTRIGSLSEPATG